MEYQTFNGADVAEALQAVKLSLGPNAMIASTSQVDSGLSGALGGSRVEVTAAAPQPDRRQPRTFDVRGLRSLPRGKKAVGRSEAPRRWQAKAASPGQQTWGAGLDAATLERELLSLRAMIEDLSATRPARERALTMLKAAGIEGTLAGELASGAPPSTRDGQPALRSWLRSRLAEHIQVEPGLIARQGMQVVACVGPTGAGKTTTLAKLAARARLDLGRSVRVISLDTFRVGAVEQWQRYAQLMGIPFHIATDPSSFEHLAQNNRSELVLVDTAGQSAADASGISSLEQCLARVSDRPLHVLLVLPARLRARDAERVVLQYEKLPLSGIVVTKLDETAQRGGVLHATLPLRPPIAYHCPVRGWCLPEPPRPPSLRLPIAYLCNGPRVPEDVQDATREAVLQAIFPDES